MKKNKPSVSDENLARFSDFLTRELEQPDLSSQITSGTHLFHGADDEVALTQRNLRLASKVMLGMSLGYVDEAPLAMIYELESGTQKLITLSTDVERNKVQSFIETFQETTQKEMAVKIHDLVAA